MGESLLGRPPKAQQPGNAQAKGPRYLNTGSGEDLDDLPKGKAGLLILPNLSGSRTEGFIVAVCTLCMVAQEIDQEPEHVTRINEDRT